MRDPHHQDHARIVEDAARWLERIERSISAQEAQALRQWLKTPAHRETIVERCKRWHGAEILAVLGELIPVEAFADRVERQYDRMVSGIFLGISGIGLITVLIAVSKILPGSDAHQNPLRAEAAIDAAVGERKTFELPDGGSIVLNSGTRAFLDYEPRSRDVTLMNGEAAFDAKYDSSRPFHVFAGSRSFEIGEGGARFNLRKMTRDQIELTVLEGQVRALESPLPDEIPPALLRARVSYGAHSFSSLEGGTLGVGWQSPAKFSPAQVDKRIAWQSGRLIFVDERLEDVLHEVERYTAFRFQFADELRTVRMSAEFGIGDTEAVRRYLRDNLRIGSHTTRSGAIVLVRMTDSGSGVAAGRDCLTNYSCRRSGAPANVRFIYGLTQIQ
jgi:transmembrane sensor